MEVGRWGGGEVGHVVDSDEEIGPDAAESTLCSSDLDRSQPSQT